MNLLLLKYNTYFNRVIKKENTKDAYISVVGSNYAWKLNIDFDLRDSIDTEQVINWTESFTPDYLVICEGSNYTISSRWFIVNWTRIRGNQYRATLHRDVIADEYDAIKEAPFFAEKGNLNINDSAIFNKEDMTVNQIKEGEFLLKDETQCGWVVGYVAKNRDNGTGTFVDTTFTEQTIPNLEATDESCSEIYEDYDAFAAAHSDIIGELAEINLFEASVQLDVCYLKFVSSFDQGITCTINKVGSKWFGESAYNHNTYLHGKNSTVDYSNRRFWKEWLADYRQATTNSLLSNITESVRTQMINEIASKNNVTFYERDSETLNKLAAYVKTNPIVKIGQRYYKVLDQYSQDGEHSTVSDEHYLTPGSKAFNLFNDNLNKQPTGTVGYSGSGEVISGNPGPETYKFKWSYVRHKLGLEEIFTSCKAKVPASVPLLKDAPYHMFAIPYSDDLTLFSGNNIHCAHTKKSTAISAAQALATSAGAGAVYDLQLLPYCPERRIIKSERVNSFLTDALWAGDSKIINGEWTIVNRQLIQNMWYAFKHVTLQPSTLKFIFECNYAINITWTGESHTYNITKLEVDSTNIKLYWENTLITTLNTSDFVSVNATKYLYIYITSTTSLKVYNNNVELLATARDTFLQRYIGNYNNNNNSLLSTIDIGDVIYSDIVKVNADQSETVLNTIIWCTESQFTFNSYLTTSYLYSVNASGEKIVETHKIPEQVIYSITKGFDATDVKIKNQTDMLRLAAPNYSNFFDINVQMNKGVKLFNVDCTYKPFAPYIHLNPDFGGLYGSDFNDVRGLVCGGDYSIALTNDAWATYQLNNKNYMQIFDRQIQSLELNNAMQKQNDIAGALGGTITGAAAGALTGAKLGGGYGAIAGAVIGGVASGIGGLADIQTNEILRNENISLQKDRFGYQLANIKALPQGLAKTNALTNNNKLYPFVEIYSCTPEEKLALANKIYYNGMTIMRIGKIKDFVINEGDFVKGTLIRLNVNKPSNYISVVNNELQKGVYL